jgi:pimeloyl-ACP methyl ester carboxylesterase
VATGSGTAWLARTGYENRNYLPAVLNGAVGDKLARAGESLAIDMSFRHERRDVPVEALAIPMASGDGRAAVFVHGLMGDELMWQQTLGGADGMATVLERERGIVPLYVRYNSGLHISQNGRALAHLLESFARAHAGDVKTLTVIGHSMGGLVVRSAEHYGREAGHSWPDLVDSIALLGAPHDGSYLEKIGHLTSFILESIPTSQTKIISRVIDERSDGIKDLRIGVLVDDDWQRADADFLPAAERTFVPLLPDVRYHVVVGTLAKDHTSIVAAYLGDGLVGKGSALGTKRDELTDAIVYKVFPKTGHMALMTSTDVQQYLVEAL